MGAAERSVTLERMCPIAFPVVWAMGMLVFAWIIAGRVRLLLRARPAARLDRMPERFKRAVVYGG